MIKRLASLLSAGLLGIVLMMGCGTQGMNLEMMEGKVQAEGGVEETSLTEEELSKSDSSENASAEETSEGADFYWGTWHTRLEEEMRSWYESLTEEDYANAKMPEELTQDDWWQKNLALLGELPEVSVKIYGEMSEGCLMILEHQGERRAFHKDFLTIRRILPEFCAYDYDGDGTPEIGMICYVGSGTGVSVMDLNVFDSVEEDFDTLYSMPYEKVLQVCEEVTYSYENDVLRIKAGDKTEEHSLSGTDFSGMEIKGLAMGDITHFHFGEDGEVICDVALAFSLEERATPFLLDEMSYLQENGVVWENRNFHFHVLYDGEGGFEADAFTLAE
ncbi:MAG: hypothetical protein J1E64_07430 [Acetatifactor sp.]|nr:hypothetical protein [Acetatifactor sp.]